jgi:hypothetical protein
LYPKNPGINRRFDFVDGLSKGSVPRFSGEGSHKTVKSLILPPFALQRYLGPLTGIFLDSNSHKQSIVYVFDEIARSLCSFVADLKGIFE